MATWITHLRIAEELLTRNLPLSKVDFLVGNIGPDCGLLNDEGKFSPPKRVTHVTNEQGIQPDLFFEQHERDILGSSSLRASYLLGYYCHLITDVEWVKLTLEKKKEQVHQAMVGSPDYNRLVKRDWYWLDFKYLKQNPDHMFWSDFQRIQEYPEYLPFFPEGQTLKQIRNITHMYCNTIVPEHYEPTFIKEVEVDDFVQETVNKIYELLLQKWGISHERN